MSTIKESYLLNDVATMHGHLKVGLVPAGPGVTATADGLTTGLIPDGSSVYAITSSVATKQISLPAAVVGTIIRLDIGATGCELISVVSGDTVNNVDVGATNEAALVATTSYTCYCTAANTWIMQGLTLLGAVETRVTPDAR
jgi:hypothetical protein